MARIGAILARGLKVKKKTMRMKLTIIFFRIYVPNWSTPLEKNVRHADNSMISHERRMTDCNLISDMASSIARDSSELRLLPSHLKRWRYVFKQPSILVGRKKPSWPRVIHIFADIHLSANKESSMEQTEALVTITLARLPMNILYAVSYAHGCLDREL